MSDKSQKEKLSEMFERMSPNEVQRARMRAMIRKREAGRTSARRSLTHNYWIAAISLSMALVLLFVVITPMGGQKSAYAVHLVQTDEANFKLEDGKGQYEDFGTSASFVDSRPSLRFFIEGKNIAMIEMTTETEYLSAKDWTETQHEKYWNVEYYQDFDEETRTSTFYPERIYDRTLRMTFDEDFDQYGNIWYEWKAQNLYEWARADNFSRFIGFGIDPRDIGELPALELGTDPDQLNEQEKLTLAAGDDGSPLGHIFLEGYPEELLKDKITIRITDHQGNVTERIIEVQVSNNEIGQTVVTAKVIAA